MCALGLRPGGCFCLEYGPKRCFLIRWLFPLRGEPEAFPPGVPSLAVGAAACAALHLGGGEWKRREAIGRGREAATQQAAPDSALSDA